VFPHPVKKATGSSAHPQSSSINTTMLGEKNAETGAEEDWYSLLSWKRLNLKGHHSDCDL